MTNRWRPLAMLAGLVGALAGMAGAGTMAASAATAVTQARHSASMAAQTKANLAPQATVLGTVHICNHRKDANNATICLQGQGVGNTVIMATSSYAVLTEIQVGTTSNGYPIVEFQNQGGHCVYADGEFNVTLQSAGCGGKSYEEWRDQPGDYSGYRMLQNVDYGWYMEIHQTVAGAGVFVGTRGGNYYNWELKPA